MSWAVKHLPNGDFEVMPESVTEIRKPDLICMDCGKLFMKALRAEVVICPRCSSTNSTEYIEAEHQDIVIKVPEG